MHIAKFLVPQSSSKQMLQDCVMYILQNLVLCIHACQCYGISFMFWQSSLKPKLVQPRPMLQTKHGGLQTKLWLCFHIVAFFKCSCILFSHHIWFKCAQPAVGSIVTAATLIASLSWVTGTPGNALLEMLEMLGSETPMLGSKTPMLHGTPKHHGQPLVALQNYRHHMQKLL